MVATTRNLCDLARRFGVRRIVHLSSMAVYGPASGIVYETTALRPAGAYGRAKRTAKQLSATMLPQVGTRGVQARLCLWSGENSGSNVSPAGLRQQDA